MLGLAKGEPAPPELLKPTLRLTELDNGVPTLDGFLFEISISDESHSEPSSIR